MTRPNKSDYTTTNQMEYDRKLNEYYKQLERYCDYLEQVIHQKTTSPRPSCGEQDRAEPDQQP